MKQYSPLPTPLDADHILASNSTLMRQAQMTACTYMEQAVVDIDEIFGKGYAKQHPDLIAAYMQVSAIDCGTGVIARAIEHIEGELTGIAQAISELAEKD